MAVTGDYFVIVLKNAHLEWGIRRYKYTRNRIYGEGYIPIPGSVATRLDVYNSNNINANTIYNCNSVDGFLEGVQLKASGSKSKGDPYAKQFQGYNNLKLLGSWFSNMNAQVGDRVRVEWVGPNDVTLELI